MVRIRPDGVPSISEFAARLQKEHAGHADRPLGGYAALLAAYAAATVAGAASVRRSGRPLPDGFSARDIALLAAATQKTSRVLTRGSVTSVGRAPFTRYQEPAGAGEVNEEPVGTGARKAVAELASCPFCASQWIATAFTFGLLLRPRATRVALSTMSALSAADFLQFGYAAASNAAHRDES